MSNLEPFVSAQLKIDRAQKHIIELQDAVERFTHENECTFWADSNADGMSFSIRLVNSDSSIFSPMIGDAIHNLRSALDHLVFELAFIDSGKEDTEASLKPRSRETDFEAATKGIKTLKADSVDFINGRECYKGGNGESLFWLHRLDVIDKHRQIIPSACVATVSQFYIMRGDQIVIDASDNTFGVSPDGHINLFMKVPSDCQIKGGQDMEVALDIRFPNIEALPGELIIPALVEIGRDVVRTRREFIEFVESRSP